MPAKIVPYSCYRTPGGRTFSRFSSFIPADAVRVDSGFTISWPDGTEGTGRVPFASVAEAEAYLAKVPAGFQGMGQR